MHNFSKNFPYLDINELIQYYAVFDGYDKLEYLHRYDNLLENIEINILGRFQQLKKNFNFSKSEQKLLHKIAIGNTKIYQSPILQSLLDKNIITIEKSREKPLKTHSHRQIKKEFRNYKIEDKAKFTKGFYRFWAYFMEPNSKEIEDGKFEDVLEIIEEELDKYISICFEKISNSLLIKEIGKDNILQSGSYWDKDIELDILIKAKNGAIVAGEVKYKNQKISKNTLNKLQKKCQKAGIKAHYFALFSKSGFSNELEKNKDKNILLYDIASFKRLCVDG